MDSQKIYGMSEFVFVPQDNVGNKNDFTTSGQVSI